MISKEDLLGYLVVLNYQPVLNKIPEDQLQIGASNIVGCMIRLVDQIEDSSYLKIAIKEREYLNCLYPVDHPDLKESTAKVSKFLYAYFIETQLNPIC